jgi:8-oxo-dGTP diphosphatase
MSPPRELFPLVLVDIALFSVADEGLQVLLVQRAEEPELRRWALPGGILRPDQDASLEAAAGRVLRDKVGVDVPHLEEVRSFSGPDRDPRGWSIATLFYALLPRDQVHAVVKSKVEAIEWADATHPGHRMAFDHGAQLAGAVDALMARVERNVLPLHLMPKRFTLTQLQRACESILDKAAFRRRLKDSPDLVALGEKTGGAQRPAQLFTARDGFEFVG